MEGREILSGLMESMRSTVQNHNIWKSATVEDILGLNVFWWQSRAESQVSWSQDHQDDKKKGCMSVAEFPSIRARKSAESSHSGP